MAKVRRELVITCEQGTSISEAAHDAIECWKKKMFWSITIKLDENSVRVGRFDTHEQIVRNYHKEVETAKKDTISTNAAIYGGIRARREHFEKGGTGLIDPTAAKKHDYVAGSDGTCVAMMGACRLPPEHPEHLK